MKRLLTLAIFSWICLAASAQKSFGYVIVGLESGFDVAQFSKGLKPRMSPALQAEVSLGRLSLGVGVGRKLYRSYEFYSFTGETTIRDLGGVQRMYYLADLHTFKPAYWTVPLKINYRLHRCDCVYLHVGITFENVDLGRPDVIKFKGAEFEPQYYSPFAMDLQRGQFVVPKTKTYEFGIGFNVFRRDFFRLTARPTYVLTENPDVYGDGPELLPTLRFTFGAQFAIWRPVED
jgi:hypothetical protein